jgi:lipopolysaccharide export LptBFGC system permease protein LptF
MSSTNELTSLRASGLSINSIVAPILFVGFCLFLCNLFIVSEITSRCRLQSKNILYEQSSKNPLLLLHRQELLHIKNSYVDFSSFDASKGVSDLLFIAPDNLSNSLDLLMAKKLKLKDSKLYGKNIATLFHMPTNNNDSYDSLILENKKTMTTIASELSKFLKFGSYHISSSSFLPLRMLIANYKLEKEKKKKIAKISTECSRRIAIGFSAFSFTYLGIAFGIDISRVKSKRKILIAALLALFIFSTFALAKSTKTHSLYFCLIYLLPQVLPLIIAKKTITKVSRGIE